MPIKKGDKIKVDYKGTLEDGTVFDDSVNHGPLEFIVGNGQLIKGFDDAVIGMAVGEEKTVKLPPKDAYGDHNPELIRKMPRQGLPSEAKEGMIIGVGLANGAQIPAKIMKIGDDFVEIDFNPPLAGKTLNFKIKIVSIN